MYRHLLPISPNPDKCPDSKVWNCECNCEKT